MRLVESAELDDCGLHGLKGFDPSGALGLLLLKALNEDFPLTDELELELELPYELSETEVSRLLDVDEASLEPLLLVTGSDELEEACGFHGLKGFDVSGAFGLLPPKALNEDFSFADELEDVEEESRPLEVPEFRELVALEDVESDELEPCGFQGLKGLYLSGAFGLSLPDALYDGVLELEDVEGDEYESLPFVDELVELMEELEACGLHGLNGLDASGAFGLLPPNALKESF